MLAGSVQEAAFSEWVKWGVNGGGSQVEVKGEFKVEVNGGGSQVEVNGGGFSSGGQWMGILKWRSMEGGSQVEVVGGVSHCGWGHPWTGG